MFLLDTNIFSHVIRKRPDPRLMLRLRTYPGNALKTSSICVMEMRHGASRLADGGALWRRIESEVLGRVEVLGFGPVEALLAGDVMANLHRAGRMIDVEDIMIGATALRHRLTVVTDNVRHFERIHGLHVEDWLSA